MNRRIFFFDIDGTICKNNFVSPRVKKAINNIQKKGDLCFVASGRPTMFLQEAVKNIGFDGYLLYNGAYVVAGDNVIYEDTLNGNEVKEILSYLRKYNSEYALQDASYNYIPKEFNRIFEFFKDDLHVNVDEFVREFDEDEVVKHLLKIEVWPDNYEVSQKFIQKFPNYKWHQYERLNMEICMKDISKAWGIQKIIDYYNIDSKNSYCFGDGPNDLEMFESVAHSYAMENADEEVKKHAKYICPSIDNDGVAVVLESLL